MKEEDNRGRGHEEPRVEELPRVEVDRSTFRSASWHRGRLSGSYDNNLDIRLVLGE